MHRLLSKHISKKKINILSSNICVCPVSLLTIFNFTEVCLRKLISSFLMTVLEVNVKDFLRKTNRDFVRILINLFEHFHWIQVEVIFGEFQVEKIMWCKIMKFNFEKLESREFPKFSYIPKVFKLSKLEFDSH